MSQLVEKKGRKRSIVRGKYAVFYWKEVADSRHEFILFKSSLSNRPDDEHIHHRRNSEQRGTFFPHSTAFWPDTDRLQELVFYQWQPPVRAQIKMKSEGFKADTRVDGARIRRGRFEAAAQEMHPCCFQERICKKKKKKKGGERAWGAGHRLSDRPLK